MERNEVEQKAFAYFQAGFICAEAVSKTLLEAFSKTPHPDIPKAATGLGGGIGGTKSEACGALTGGVIALGCLHGRTEPGDDKQKVYRLAAEYRKRFIDKFGTSNCGNILAGFGAQENMMKCKRLTADATGILYDILREDGHERP